MGGVPIAFGVEYLNVGEHTLPAKDAPEPAI